MTYRRTDAQTDRQTHEEPFNIRRSLGFLSSTSMSSGFEGFKQQLSSPVCSTFSLTIKSLKVESCVGNWMEGDIFVSHRIKHWSVFRCHRVTLPARPVCVQTLIWKEGWFVHHVEKETACVRCFRTEYWVESVRVLDGEGFTEQGSRLEKIPPAQGTGRGVDLVTLP